MKIKNFLIGSIVVTGTGYLLYSRLLSDDAKAEVKKMAHSVYDSYTRVSEIIGTMTGQVIEDPSALPNVQVTKQQWEKLGY